MVLAWKNWGCKTLRISSLTSDRINTTLVYVASAICPMKYVCARIYYGLAKAINHLQWYPLFSVHTQLSSHSKDLNGGSMGLMQHSAESLLYLCTLWRPLMQSTPTAYSSDCDNGAQRHLCSQLICVYSKSTGRAVQSLKREWNNPINYFIKGCIWLPLFSWTQSVSC